LVHYCFFFISNVISKQVIPWIYMVAAAGNASSHAAFVHDLTLISGADPIRGQGMKARGSQ